MVDFGQGAKGAAGGAAVGTTILPGWGTAIGAGLGGLAGLFGGGGNNSAQSDIQKKLMELSDSYKQRTVPTAGEVTRAGQSGYRSNQAALISQLEGMARGEGPSAAAIQMREAMDRAAAAQTGAAAGAGGRGVNQGAAYLNAANNGAAIMAQGARDTATLRSQEQLNAVGQLGQNLQSGINSDNQMSQFNAGAANQLNLANLQAQLQTMGLNDEGQLRALMGALGANVGPGTGTQIMAGGASAIPALTQMFQQQRNAGSSPPADLDSAYNSYRQGSPITQPGQV